MTSRRVRCAKLVRGKDAGDDTVEHVRPKTVKEVGDNVLGAEEYEGLDEAPPSARAAVLGKGGSSASAGSEKEERGLGKDEDENGFDFGQDYSEERCIPVREPMRKPSAREIAQHNLTHVPFRPWCEVRVCVYAWSGKCAPA